MYNVSNRTGRAQLYLRKSAQFCPRQPASTRTCLKREFPAALPRWNCYLPALQAFQIFSKCFKGHKMSQTSSPGSASVKSKPMTVALTPQCLFGTASSLAIGFCKSDEQQWNSTVISKQDPSKFSVNSICNKKFNSVQAQTWVYASTFLRRISLARKPVPRCSKYLVCSKF